MKKKGPGDCSAENMKEMRESVSLGPMDKHLLLLASSSRSPRPQDTFLCLQLGRSGLWE